MRKVIQYIAAGGLLLLLLPVVAQAHEVNVGLSDNANIGIHAEDRFRTIDVDKILEQAKGDLRGGTVTAVSGSSFTLKANNGLVYTVNTDANTAFNLPFQGHFTLASIQVNDAVRVRGTVTGSTIAAVSVVDVPANKRPAKANGTVTAVSGSSLTVQTKHNNTVIVNTDSNTQVTKTDGSTGAMTDVTVGSKVSIKGLWDMVLNVLSAIKIHIK